MQEEATTAEAWQERARRLRSEPAGRGAAPRATRSAGAQAQDRDHTPASSTCFRSSLQQPLWSSTPSHAANSERSQPTHPGPLIAGPCRPLSSLSSRSSATPRRGASPRQCWCGRPAPSPTSAAAACLRTAVLDQESWSSGDAVGSGRVPPPPPAVAALPQLQGVHHASASTACLQVVHLTEQAWLRCTVVSWCHAVWCKWAQPPRSRLPTGCRRCRSAAGCRRPRVRGPQPARLLAAPRDAGPTGSKPLPLCAPRGRGGEWVRDWPGRRDGHGGEHPLGKGQGGALWLGWPAAGEHGAAQRCCLLRPRQQVRRSFGTLGAGPAILLTWGT